VSYAQFTEQLTISVTPEVAQRVADLAASQGRSKSSILRDVIDAGLAELEPTA
jgi:predicted DNA-binding protein